MSRREGGGFNFLPLCLALGVLPGAACPVHAQQAPAVSNVSYAQTPYFAEAWNVRNIFKPPLDQLDLARTKLTIDKLIDPTIDIEAHLRTIDAMVRRIRSMPEFGESGSSKLTALRRFIYESGTWNDHRPFQYDLDDPFGAKISNKLLSNYLASKKGNCVTMPFLFIILGQRLGIDVTASTAPMHIFVKFRNDAGAWINLEATSGASPARDVWIRSQMPMTDQAIANGLYLQPLTKKETAAMMATTLGEYYLHRREYEKAIAIADVILEHYPKGVETMVLKGASYGHLVTTKFIDRYPMPSQIPANMRDYYQYLSQNNRFWYAKAEALGWREETKADEAKYLERVRETGK